MGAVEYGLQTLRFTFISNLKRYFRMDKVMANLNIANAHALGYNLINTAAS